MLQAPRSDEIWVSGTPWLLGLQHPNQPKSGCRGNTGCSRHLNQPKSGCMGCVRTGHSGDGARWSLANTSNAGCTRGCWGVKDTPLRDRLHRRLPICCGCSLAGKQQWKSPVKVQELALRRRVGLGDPQRSPPTPAALRSAGRIGVQNLGGTGGLASRPPGAAPGLAGHLWALALKPQRRVATGRSRAHPGKLPGSPRRCPWVEHAWSHMEGRRCPAPSRCAHSHVTAV